MSTLPSDLSESADVSNSPKVPEMPEVSDSADVPEFPYKRNFMKDPMYYFENLRTKSYLMSNEFIPANSANFGENQWKYNNLTLYICMHRDVYDDCDMITDWYTEYARIKASVRGHKSPYETWQDPKFRSRVETIVNKYSAKQSKSNKKLSRCEITREAIYANIKECTNFKVSAAVEIYKLFNARIVFDPFGGWGDRMIGAAAAGVIKYVCTDINDELTKGYAAMSEMLNTNSESVIKYRIMPIEKYSLLEFKDDFGSNAPDCIFTSSPFHNYEIYNIENPIIEKYDSWLNEWLLPVIDQLWNMLKPMGYLALHLPAVPTNKNNVKKSSLDMATDLLKHQSKHGRKFNGIIACGYDKKFPLPIYVWQKRNNEPILINS
jgi:hypothetical protein